MARGLQRVEGGASDLKHISITHLPETGRDIKQSTRSLFPWLQSSGEEKLIFHYFSGLSSQITQYLQIIRQNKD